MQVGSSVTSRPHIPLDPLRNSPMTRGKAMMRFSIILHPTDLSEDSMAAFRVACG